MSRPALLCLFVATLGLGPFACHKAASGPQYDLPLDPASPWPKFRRDSVQDALGAIHPSYNGSSPWTFPTGKGVFSSPVVAGDGTIYVGSGDRYFYALSPSGQLVWKTLTGQLIDSAALVDDQKHVYFASGDGFLYAVDGASGAPLWNFEADDPSTIHDGFSYIRWFEGNVGMGPGGELYVPNDNNNLYAIDRDSGAKLWSFLTTDVIWSLPAVNVGTGDFFFGNNSVLGAIVGAGANVYGLGGTGNQQWTNFTLGTIAASPLLTSDGSFILGSFDGYVRAFDQRTGQVRWSFATRDHIYASPALLPDGTIVQPSADGTVYGLDPATGALRWNYDTFNPIRSSPAVDADGNIYMGTGSGQLLVLNANGSRRWAMTLINQDRDDLNSSPALGQDAIYIGGEDGSIFSVPYDYCLHGAGLADASCEGGGGTTLPANGVFLYYTGPFGTPVETPPATIDANDALAFSLYVRQNGQTPLTLIDSTSVTVTVTPPSPVITTVSGDRRFMTVVPQTTWATDANGNVTIDITGNYLQNLDRTGLVLTGGTVGGPFSGHYVWQLNPDTTGPIPVPIPQAIGDPAGILQMTRLAVPLPTVLPSYNQIGFDSLIYLVGLVEGSESHAIAWVVGGTLAADQNTVVFDPTTQAVFPLELTYAGGRLTAVNNSSFSLEVTSAVISFDTFRLNARVDATGTSTTAPHLTVTTTCSHIPTFGTFLESIGFCNPQTDGLVAYGSVLLAPFNSGTQTMPAGVGTVSFAVTASTVTATLAGSTLMANAHIYSIGLIDETTGHPLPISYGLSTTTAAGAGGSIQSVSLALGSTVLPATVRIYLLVDAYPVARLDYAAP